MKVFRNLRLRLLRERRLANYLAYAFGEIVLVVVGILIAVQIHAWNAARDERASERLYLSKPYYSGVAFEHGTAERSRVLTRRLVDALSVRVSREEIQGVLGIDTALPRQADIDYRVDGEVWSGLFLLDIAIDVLAEELQDQRGRGQRLIAQIDAGLAA